MPHTSITKLAHSEGLRPLPPTPEKRRAPVGFQFVSSSLRLAALLSCLSICAHVRAHVCVRRPVRKAPYHPDQDFEERSLSASKTLFFRLKTAPGPPRRLIRKAPEQDLAESFLSASKTSAFPFKTAPEPPRRPVRKAPDQDLAESSFVRKQNNSFSASNCSGASTALMLGLGAGGWGWTPEQNLAKSSLSASKTAAFLLQTAPEPPRR